MKTCPICKQGKLFVREKDTPDEQIYCKSCPATWSDGKLPEGLEGQEPE